MTAAQIATTRIDAANNGVRAAAWVIVARQQGEWSIILPSGGRGSTAIEAAAYYARLAWRAAVDVQTALEGDIPPDATCNACGQREDHHEWQGGCPEVQS